jgi:NADH-quinone oxidoreductase subunit A
MTDSLVPALVALLISIAVAGGMLVVSWLLGRPRKSLLDDSPYECGITPIDRLERHRFSVRFYLVAMLFILFDIEAAFLFPWAVTLTEFAADKVFVLVEMMVFLGIIVAGFLYIWWRGALEWE